MKNYAIFCKNDDTSSAIRASLEKLLKKFSSEFRLDEQNPELVFVVGGDGTLIRAIHSYIDNLKDIAFVGINTGTLGYLMEFEPNELVGLIALILKNKTDVESYYLLKAEIAYSNKKYETLYAVNEFNLHKNSGYIDSDVYLDDEYLERYRGSGFIVCGLIGSTGLARSYNGSILVNRKDLLEIIEVAPLRNRLGNSIGSPLIIDNSVEVHLRVNLKDINVGYDSDYLKVENCEEITIGSSDKEVLLMKNPYKNKVEKIRESLIWKKA